jgi:hypothetical protein
MEVVPQTEHGLRMAYQVRKAMPTVFREQSTLESPQQESAPSENEARSTSEALGASTRQESPERKPSHKEQHAEVQEQCDFDHMESDITTDLRHLLREFQILDDLPNRISTVFQRFRREAAERVRMCTCLIRWFFLCEINLISAIEAADER